MIWSSDLINWYLSHHIIIQFFMHERLDHESHLLIWDDSYCQFSSSICWFSNRVVLRSFSRDDLFKSRWFFSYLLIFEIVENSKSSKMSMRFWWNQIEVRTKLEDILIRRKESRDDRRSRSSKESRWIMRWKISKWDCRRNFYIMRWIFHLD
jgi:hypothetical protein